MKVYLAGPIAGLTYRDSETWRDYVKSALNPYGIRCYSPLRRQEYLTKRGLLTAGPYDDDDCMNSDDGIMVRDHFDCMTCDLVLANFLGASRISIGTVMELGFAYAHRKPVVAVMEPTGNVHDHPMVRKAAVFRVPTLEAGTELVRDILLP